jgi:kumamolisin
MRSLQAMQAAGINHFVASGDWGAYTCWNQNKADHRPSVDIPSCTPYTIAVGGTYLSVREDGTYFEETGWEDFLTVGGTGGGLSPADPRPPWQVGPGVENEYSNGNRQCPDVAAAGDGDTGYRVFFQGVPITVGGTSASAPFWAGATALIQQYVEEQGRGPLGYLNPILYRLADREETDAYFNDVVRGGNLLHNATPGWDYATGIGSPKVDALARAIADELDR